LPQELMMEFNVRYTYFRNQVFNGFSADFKVGGDGKSPDEARQMADIGYAKLREFLAEEDIIYHLG
ncbi:MAG TPA: hypothetical protein VE732_04865, partial [Nitrososphaera sp.]|nr:hypothetical protein [Nitrososphaera sp.]